MANPGRIVAEIGKALGKAIIAGVGLELARVVTKAVKVRFGARDGDDEDDDGAATKNNTKVDRKAEANVDDAAALRRENAALREELGALRREFEAERRKP
jgi:hypothetical protein